MQGVFGSILLAAELVGDLDDVLLAQAELLQQVIGGAGEAVDVVDTDAADGGGALLGQAGADSLAQTADDGVLLAGDDLTALLGSGDDQLLVQGLDGAHIDDHGIDALLGQGLGGVDGLVDHQAGGDDGNIGALAHDIALADLELEVLLIVEHGHSQTAEADIDGAVVLIGSLDSGLGLDVVGGVHDDHASSQKLWLIGIKQVVLQRR